MTQHLPFWIAAVFGTTVVGLQLAMMMLGLSTDDVGDAYHDIDSPEGSEDSFKVLSIQTISSFFMAFGWGGLAAIEQFGLPESYGTLVAIALGLCFVYIIKSIFKLAMSLASPGTEYDLNDIIGQKVNVFERILPNGNGRIQVFVGGMIREIDAISDSDQEVPTGQQVEVIEIINLSTVKVK